MSQDLQIREGTLDLAQAMDNLDGDIELLREIIEIFVDTAGDQFRSLDASIAEGDVQNVAINAHAMKGGASNFCAARFVASARALELLAKDGSLVGAEKMLEQMKAEFGDLQDVLDVINWEEVAGSWNG